ncbi:MAG: hypothetical protein LAT55_13380, partial [Opitutales bacterium]|nr:hypothetical protein [Opitutales bacterium]
SSIARRATDGSARANRPEIREHPKISPDGANIPQTARASPPVDRAMNQPDYVNSRPRTSRQASKLGSSPSALRLPPPSM